MEEEKKKNEKGEGMTMASLDQEERG